MNKKTLSHREMLEELLLHDLAPPAPCEILRRQFLDKLNIKPSTLAVESGVHKMTISKLLNGQARFTMDTARRIAICLGTSTLFWINLQNRFEEIFFDHCRAEDVKDIHCLAHD